MLLTSGAAGLGVLLSLIFVKFLLYVAAAKLAGGVEASLCQWDCTWYVHTIQNGYDPEPRLSPAHDYANWAFFPLYPLLARLLGILTGLGPFWSGTATSVLCFAGFAVLSARYRALTRPGSRTKPWAVLLLVYPFSLYFFMVYTESLNLLLTVLLLISVQLRAYTGAAVVTGLLTAARPTGVLAIPYLIVERVWCAYSAFQPGITLSSRLRILADSLFSLALMPLGIASYMVYLYWLTGDALAFSHVQVAWGRSFTNPLKTFYWGLSKFDLHLLLDPSATQSSTYAASFAILAGLTCAWLLMRGLALEAWLLGATVLLALTTSVDSLPRYVGANPIFLLAAGDVADRIRSRTARVGLALACVLLQGILLHHWFIRSFLLM